MPNANYTAILLIMDVSGSMSQDVMYNGQQAEVYEVMQDVIHLMLEQQARKLAGYLTVDVGHFDTRANMLVEDGDPLLTDIGLYAGGGTQIYDTSAQLLAQFENRLKSLPENEQPGHVVVIIMSDGDSSPAQGDGVYVKQTISRLTGEGWDFAFLAASQYGVEGSRKGLGISADHSIKCDNSQAGIEDAADKLGSFVSVARGGGNAAF